MRASANAPDLPSEGWAFASLLCHPYYGVPNTASLTWQAADGSLPALQLAAQHLLQAAQQFGALLGPASKPGLAAKQFTGLAMRKLQALRTEREQ